MINKQVKSLADIVTENGTNLETISDVYKKGLCPFCNEPSFVVSIPRDTYYCFKCHLGGNADDFVYKIDQRKKLAFLKDKFKDEFNNGKKD